MSRLNLDIGDLDFSGSMAPVIKLRLTPHRGLKWKSKGEKSKKKKRFKQVSYRLSGMALNQRRSRDQ